MKKLILCVGIVFLFTGAALAQKKPDSLDSWLDRIYAEQEAKNLKSYYASRTIADTCEKWRSCAKWAFEEYEKDQTFKITKAQFKTQTRTHRHRVIRESHLFIEATYEHRTVRLEFTTPRTSGRARPYNYIAKFP